MKVRSVGSDKVFFTLLLILAFLGLAIFSSATLGLLARDSAPISRDILTQAGIGLGLGFALLFVVRAIPLTQIKKYAPYVYLAALVFTAFVFVPGIGFHAGGATRWINLGFTTVQPAEFLKIGVILGLAWWLSIHARELKNPKKGLIPLLIIIGIPSVLLLLQPNTSTTILLAATAGIVYLASGGPIRDIGIALLIGLVALGGIILIRPYVLQRIETFFHPQAHAYTSSYQIQQSLLAIGSGGVLGRGFGQSVEKFNYLPEPDGDSVFAVFAEETGIIGALVLLALFVGLCGRGMVIAGTARDYFGGLATLGFSVLILLQAFINITAMLGLIPLTGMPLPLVSHGGTALIAILVMCGIILNVSAHRKV